jgi:hypothetical protein
MSFGGGGGRPLQSLLHHTFSFTYYSAKQIFMYLLAMVYLHLSLYVESHNATSPSQQQYWQIITPFKRYNSHPGFRGYTSGKMCGLCLYKYILGPEMIWGSRVSFTLKSLHSKGKSL